MRVIATLICEYNVVKELCWKVATAGSLLRSMTLLSSHGWLPQNLVPGVMLMLLGSTGSVLQDISEGKDFVNRTSFVQELKPTLG